MLARSLLMGCRQPWRPLRFSVTVARYEQQKTFRESFHAGKGYGRRDGKDRHDGVRIWEGKRAQENRVDNAENGRVRADAQAQHGER
jgi:hypothetical protein